jgi:Concanavalin A-like lectin/glucanases superfamily
MKTLLGLAAAMITGGATVSFGQTLEADYQLQNTYDSSIVSGIGPLGVTGDPAGANFVSDTVNGNTQQVLQITTTEIESPPTIGVVQTGVQAQTNPFINSANYSAVLLSNFQTSPSSDGITKVMDFDNLSSDAGLYINDATGLLGFYNGSEMVLGTSMTPVVTGQYAQIVLTRDSSTNLVTVYVNGAAQFSFTDSTGLAVLGDASNTGNAYLTLYQDDGQGIGGSIVNEGTVGNIARLRLYDGALSADQVAALDTVVPEPATCVLLALGLIPFLARSQSKS